MAPAQIPNEAAPACFAPNGDDDDCSHSATFRKVRSRNAIGETMIYVSLRAVGLTPLLLRWHIVALSRLSVAWVAADRSGETARTPGSSRLRRLTRHI